MIANIKFQSQIPVNCRRLTLQRQISHNEIGKTRHENTCKIPVSGQGCTKFHKLFQNTLMDLMRWKKRCRGDLNKFIWRFSLDSKLISTATLKTLTGCLILGQITLGFHKLIWKTLLNDKRTKKLCFRHYFKNTQDDFFTNEKRVKSSEGRKSL